MERLLVFLAVLCTAVPAWAYRDMSRNVVAASSGFQNLITTVCWIAGSIYIVAGVRSMAKLWKMANTDDGYAFRNRRTSIYFVTGILLLWIPFLQNALAQQRYPSPPLHAGPLQTYRIDCFR